MANDLEKIKAKIEFFKTLFLVFVTALFSIIGYLFVNFQKLTSIKLFILLYVIIVLVVIVFGIVLKWLEEIEKLKG